MPHPAVIDFMQKRRSVLAAKMIEPAPSSDDLREIIEIGLRVPDHGKIQPWRIQILRESAQRALGEVYAATLDPTVCSPAQEQAARDLLCRSPLLLVVSCHPNPEKFLKVPLIEQQLSAGAVCSNLLIAAGALGYAAQWLTGGPAYSDTVKLALGLAVEHNIVGFVHLGSIDSPPMERPRPDYDDIVSEWIPDA